ncbi:hypothetical protein [Cyclobacterium marinum]|uniref:Uncharacterized protein n=1 Tax=Cyclobacterium marinum (strain ATCC 25205 / DSM 745 / LMG 13164 / NCIMB 1802) TaxID=880070 RepID=G0J3A3_CYCMS|nr:hypothetical protein [Cyclobacterium marinum]AEL24044.1 hypothetical protein Cycma_0263 [Cyclobacterium marinum DSM 745]
MKNKYECCKCGWTGFHSEKRVKPNDGIPFLHTYVCPNCGHDSFYEIKNEECTGEKLPLTDAIQFGNYLNQNAEKWGDE